MAKILDYPVIQNVTASWYLLIDSPDASDGGSTSIIGIRDLLQSQIDDFGAELFYTLPYEALSLVDASGLLPLLPDDDNPSQCIASTWLVNSQEPSIDEYGKGYGVIRSSLYDMITLGMRNRYDLFSLIGPQQLEVDWPYNTSDIGIYLSDPNGNDGKGRMISQSTDIFLLNLLNNGFLNNTAAYKKNIVNPICIGTTLDDAQVEEIQNGTFRNLWLGSYWLIDGIEWQIVDFDYYLNLGESYVSNHHVTIMPMSTNWIYKMNDSNTTEGGYANCKLRTDNLITNILDYITEIFGSNHILLYQVRLSNAVDENGDVSGTAWYNTKIELPNQKMIYGCNPISSRTFGEIESTQLSLFNLTKEFIRRDYNYWLRDMAEDAPGSFVISKQNGIATVTGASSNSIRVRPVFSIY